MTPNPTNDAALAALLTKAQGYADHALRTAGSVTPALFLDTPGGLILCMLAGPDMSEETKDNMATACRMLAVSHSATAVVLVLEAWVVRAKDGKLDTATRPSLSPDREEVISLLGENLRGTRTRLLPIMRNAKGSFTGLGEPDMPECNGGEGRFAGILPRETPDIKEVIQASYITRSMGLKPGEFKPEWN